MENLKLNQCKSQPTPLVNWETTNPVIEQISSISFTRECAIKKPLKILVTYVYITFFNKAFDENRLNADPTQTKGNSISLSQTKWSEVIQITHRVTRLLGIPLSAALPTWPQFKSWSSKNSYQLVQSRRLSTYTRNSRFRKFQWIEDEPILIIFRPRSKFQIILMN